MLSAIEKDIIAGAEKKMQDAVAFLEASLKDYRVGKANPSVFNKVLVNYYGTPTPLPQVGTVSAPDAEMSSGKRQFRAAGRRSGGKERTDGQSTVQKYRSA